MKRCIISCLVLVLIALSVSPLAAEETVANAAPMNSYILDVIKTFPMDGSHTYWWPRSVPFDGATTDVFMLDRKVMRGDPGNKNRSYCCGLTLQTFYLALQEYERKTGKSLPESRFTKDTSRNFIRLWFCPELKSPGPVLAMETYGIGHRIKKFEEALPGDFVQIWRNSGSGHSVIFAGWQRNEKGKITALIYWSTQPATNGIGYRVEAIGDGKKDITREHLYIGRLDPPDTWAKPDDE